MQPAADMDRSAELVVALAGPDASEQFVQLFFGNAAEGACRRLRPCGRAMELCALQHHARPCIAVRPTTIYALDVLSSTPVHPFRLAGAPPLAAFLFCG